MLSRIKRQKERSPNNCYSEAFKIKVVKEVEQGLLNKDQARRKYGIKGKSAVLYWCRKYGKEEYLVKKKQINKKYSPDEKDKKIKELQTLLAHERFKVDALEAMIEVANEMYGTDLKKKLGSKRLQK